MTGAMCVVAPGSSVQLLLAVLVMLIYTMTILKTAPYEEDTEDWSSFIACSALTLTTIGGFALITDDPDAPTYETILLSHLLIGINIVCFAIDILIVIMFDCQLYERCARTVCRSKVIETKNEKIDKSNKTKVQPILNIKPGSEQHKKLRDTRLQYGAGSKEYKEVAMNIQEKQSTELKETENQNTEPVSPKVKSKAQSKPVLTVVGTKSSLAITVMMLVGSFVVGGAEGQSVGTCDAGYYLGDNNMCTAWAGACANGVLKPLLERTANDQCGSCNDGFWFDQGACKAAYAKMPDGCKGVTDSSDRTCYPRKAVDEWISGWTLDNKVDLNKNTGDGTFGYSVAISSEFAIVGAWAAKKAFIFKNTGGTWGTTAAFNLDQNTDSASFGHSVAISGEFAIVGAFGAKKAFIFKNTGGTWGTTAAFTLDQNTGDGSFGYSVAISSEFAIVGAWGAKKAFIFQASNAVVKYGPIENWDMSEITDMSYLFDQKKTFNSDISKWDVSSTTNMQRSK